MEPDDAEFDRDARYMASVYIKCDANVTHASFPSVFFGGLGQTIPACTCSSTLKVGGVVPMSLVRRLICVASVRSSRAGR